MFFHAQVTLNEDLLFGVKMHCLTRKQKIVKDADASNNILGLKNYATCVQIDLGGTVNW